MENDLVVVCTICEKKMFVLVPLLLSCFWRSALATVACTGATALYHRGVVVGAKPCPMCGNRSSEDAQKGSSRTGRLRPSKTTIHVSSIVPQLGYFELSRGDFADKSAIFCMYIYVYLNAK